MHRFGWCRPGFWRVVATILVVAWVLSLAPVARQGEAATPGAIEFLQRYGLVKGDPNGDLRLGSPITRAEFATVLVRLVGKEQEARMLTGLPAFPDTGDHWSSGYVAVATRLGLVKGYEDGTFRPDQPVRYAEALTLLLRLVGQEPTAGSWPENVLVRSIELRIQPSDVALGAVALEAAPRAHVFESLYLAGTRVPTGSDQKTLFARYVKTTPPELALDAVPEVTTQERIVISGTATDAVEVRVGGSPVSLSGGRFRTEVFLRPGNNDIVVEAVDVVGNRTTRTLRVARAVEPAAIRVSGPTTVKAGTKVQYSVQVLDRSGIDMATAGLTVQVEGNIGTFDKNTLTLTAAPNAAKGRLVFTAGTVTRDLAVTVQGPSAAAKVLRVSVPGNSTVLGLNRDITVQVAAVDDFGNVVTEDNDRTVQLVVTDLDGVVVTPPSQRTVNGVATFTVRSAQGGAATLRATAAGLTAGELAVQFATPLRVRLTASPERATPDGVTQITVSARLENEQGVAVPLTAADQLVIELSASGPGTVEDGTIVIPRNYATAPYDQASVRVGSAEGTLSISGRVTQGPPYTVLPATIPVAVPRLGAGAKFRISGPSRIDRDATQEFTVMLVDANGDIITDGSFAFQLAVETNNGETVTAGVPEGVSVRLGDTDLVPVDDGVAEGGAADGEDVVARTLNGVAKIKLSYDKSGLVTLKVVPKGATASAYDHYGNEGTAAAANVASDPFTVQVRGPIAGLRLTAISALGEDQPAAAVAPGGTMRVRGYVVDDRGYWIPGASLSSIQLVKTTDGTSITLPSTTTRSAVDGKVEFEIRATNTAGVERVRLQRSGYDPSNELEIEVESARPAEPVIRAIRGFKADRAPSNGLVAPDDEYMEILLEPMAEEGWAQVRVYRSGSNSVLFTSGAVDLRNAPSVVRVPRSIVPTGTDLYFQVSIRNSRGEGPKSAAWGPVTVAKTLGGLSISRAIYDATTDTLKVYTSGSMACTGTIQAERLRLVSGSGVLNLAGRTAYVAASNGAPCTTATSSMFVVLMDGTLDLSTIAGAVNLEADAGWYVNQTGDQAAEDKTSNPVTPMARIDRVELDLANNRLYLVGVGFNTGTMDLTKLSITGSGQPFRFVTGSCSSSTATVSSHSRVSDTRYLINLCASGATQLRDGTRFSGTGVKFQAEAGWYKSSGTTGGNNAAQLDVPVYHRVTVTRVQYYNAPGSEPPRLVISGSGFADGHVNRALIRLRDDDNPPVTLDLTAARPGQEDRVTPNSITLYLTDQQNSQYQTSFDGWNIYFETTGDGWFTNGQGIPALALPDETYTVNPPTN